MTQKRRRPWWVIPVVTVALLGVLVGATGVVFSVLGNRTGTADSATVIDMAGKTVSLDPGELPVPVSSSHAVAATGARLKVPSVGLDVPLGALNAVDGQITPPGFTSAYWVRNVGVPVSKGAKGTVFVVMHSLRGGGTGPGNYLTDVNAQRSKVSDGATVSIDGQEYTVTGSQLVTKATIDKDAGVWANTPNRLLLITCLERPDGAAPTDNLVITAVRNP